MKAPTHDPEFLADLMACALQTADAETRRGVRARCGSAAEYDRLLARIRRTLAPLDDIPAPQPPADLDQRILAAVSQHKTLPLRPVREAAAGSEAGGRGPLVNFREFVGLAAAILLFVSIFVPGYRTARLQAQKAACQSNMRQIGAGFVNYSEENRQYFPYAGRVSPDASWARVPRAGAPQLINSQHVFQLVNRRYVSPEAFHCPGREGDVALESVAPDALADFPDPRNNSYSTHLVTQPLHRRQFAGDRPLAADLTPLVDDQRQVLSPDQRSENSRSHARLGGQNILRANMSVIFSPTPHVGLENDDIYRIIGIEQYTGFERPRARSDAFLVP